MRCRLRAQLFWHQPQATSPHRKLGAWMVGQAVRKSLLLHVDDASLDGSRWRLEIVALSR